MLLKWFSTARFSALHLPRRNGVYLEAVPVNKSWKKKRTPVRPEQTPKIDTPSEANTTKHINFTDKEAGDIKSGEVKKDDGTRERQKQWRQGLEEGKRDLDQHR